MINSIANTIELAKQAWRGLRALPEVERIAWRATVDMERREAASKSLLDELAASRKHVAALEQQLAAACGGLKVEQERHEGTERELTSTAAICRAKDCDIYEMRMELEREKGEHESARLKLVAVSKTLNNVAEERDRLSVELNRYRARYPEESSIMDVVG